MIHIIIDIGIGEHQHHGRGRADGGGRGVVVSCVHSLVLSQIKGKGG